MSTSILYHAFNLRELVHRSTRFEDNKVILRAEMKESKVCCEKCESRDVIFKGKKERSFHMPRLGRKLCMLESVIHRIKCRKCGALYWPELSFMIGKKRYTRSFALTVMDLLQFSTIKSIANYLGVGWDMIKGIHKNKLEEEYRSQPLKEVVYLGLDEFSICKGHSYMTIFVDLESGRILHAVEGRSSEAITPFLKQIAKKAKNLQAVAMDMSGSYQKAVKEQLPEVDIVFDRYHISALANRSMDELRRVLMWCQA